MPLALSTHDLQALEELSRALLTPFRYETLTAWRADIRRRLTDLLGADHSFSVLPVLGEPLVECPPDLEPARDAYVAYYRSLDTGLYARRRELGLEVYNWRSVYDLDYERRHGEKYNDFNLPHGLLDVTGMVTEPEGFENPAAFLVYHDSENTPPFGERGLALFRLLLPAFKAGFHSCLLFARHRSQLLTVFDRLSCGIGVYDLGGRLLHANPLLEELMTRPDGARMRTEVESMVRGLAALSLARRRAAADGRPPGPSYRRLRVGTEAYELSATLLPPGMSGGRHEHILVAVEEQRATAAVSSVALRERHGLTPREEQVARLLAQGQRTREIAQALGISDHTARHHTEAVLRKLGVHTRAAVASVLQAL